MLLELIHKTKLLNHYREGRRAGDNEVLREKTVKGGGNDLCIPPKPLTPHFFCCSVITVSAKVKNNHSLYQFVCACACVCVFMK